MIRNIIYLHGFASSPGSSKATRILNYFRDKNVNIFIPDLNCGDFSSVTITKMLSLIDKTISEVSDKFIIVGSSLGGYLASLYVHNFRHLPERMLLLAPAFNLYRLFRTWLSEVGIKEWERNGHFKFFHYALNTEIPLHYDFYRDLESYPPYPDIHRVPAHIIYGADDNVVSISFIKEFITLNPNTTLETVKDGHELSNSINLILHKIEEMLF